MQELVVGATKGLVLRAERQLALATPAAGTLGIESAKQKSLSLVGVDWVLCETISMVTARRRPYIGRAPPAAWARRVLLSPAQRAQTRPSAGRPKVAPPRRVTRAAEEQRDPSKP